MHGASDPTRMLAGTRPLPPLGRTEPGLRKGAARPRAGRAGPAFLSSQMRRDPRGHVLRDDIRRARAINNLHAGGIFLRQCQKTRRATLPESQRPSSSNRSSPERRASPRAKAARASMSMTKVRSGSIPMTRSCRRSTNRAQVGARHALINACRIRETVGYDHRAPVQRRLDGAFQMVAARGVEQQYFGFCRPARRVAFDQQAADGFGTRCAARLSCDDNIMPCRCQAFGQKPRLCGFPAAINPLDADEQALRAHP